MAVKNIRQSVVIFYENKISIQREGELKDFYEATNAKSTTLLRVQKWITEITCGHQTDHREVL